MKMKTVRILGIIYLISGNLLVLITILINPINIFIDILILFGFFLITIAFLIMLLEISRIELKNINSN